MGFLGLTKKKKEKKPLKPFSEVEFPPMPSELFGDMDETEIPAPPKDIFPKKMPEISEEKGLAETRPIEHKPIEEISEDLKEVEEKLRIRPKKSIFVSSNKFRGMLSEIKTSKKKLSDIKTAIGGAGELKSKKDKEFEIWREELEDIQRKLIFIDKTLFGG